MKGIKEIELKTLLLNIINGIQYNYIYAQDGDKDFHTVDSIDILYEKIYCEDGWYQYFEAFDGENNFLYIQEVPYEKVSIDRRV